MLHTLSPPTPHPSNNHAVPTQQAARGLFTRLPYPQLAGKNLPQGTSTTSGEVSIWYPRRSHTKSFIFNPNKFQAEEVVWQDWLRPSPSTQKQAATPAPHTARPPGAFVQADSWEG